MRDPSGVTLGRVRAHLSADPAAYLLLMWDWIPVWRALLSGHQVRLRGQCVAASVTRARGSGR